MFLDILEFAIEEEEKNRGNGFESVVSEIHKKNLFCPYNPPKIRSVFMFVCF